MTTLLIFDLDETLFHTKANVYVVKNGQRVKALTNQQFNLYRLKSGEQYDFSEFMNVRLLKATSIPIKPMIAKAKAMIRNMKEGSKVIILTARASFDNRQGGNKEVIKFFQEKYGILFDSLVTAGDIHNKTPSEAKKYVVEQMIQKDKSIKTIRVYDDSKSNLDKIAQIKKKDVMIELYLVRGSTVTKYPGKMSA